MQAPLDQNHVAGKLGVLFTDPSVTIPIAIDEATGSMKVNTTDTVQFTMTPIAIEDQNFKDVLLFEGTDGLTYPWVVDASGIVLINM